MQDYEQAVLEQYNIDVTSTRKIRGAILCDTKQGFFVLKEVMISENRIPALCEMYEYLQMQQVTQVDAPIKNKEDEYVSVSADGKKYMLRKWFGARECDVRKPVEVLEAAGMIAKLHISMCVKLDSATSVAIPLQGEYVRHNRELKKIRKFMRAQAPKGDFEFSFLKYFEQVYAWAAAGLEMLEQSGCQKLYEKSVEEGYFTHGEYNYHNVLMRPNGRANEVAAVTSFDHFKRDVQVEDLYYFLRKVMEKYGWKERLGENMLNAYQAIRPLSEEEWEYLKIRLVYPEKTWKIANAYYHSNKAWIPAKNIEKLEVSIRQMQEKERFLANIFAFHL